MKESKVTIKFVHNTQEIKTIDFDDLDFLSQDNISKKTIWIFFRVKLTTPRCHSSFYRALLSLVVHHFWVSVILNSFIITCVVRHFNCPESKIRVHIVFALSSVYVKIGTGASVFHKRILFDFEIPLHPSFCFVFFYFAVWVRVCKLYDDILYRLDWTAE